MSTSQSSSNVNTFQEGLNLAKSPSTTSKPPPAIGYNEKSKDLMQRYHGYLARLQGLYQSRLSILKDISAETDASRRPTWIPGQLTRAQDDLVDSIGSILTRVPGLAKRIQSLMDAPTGFGNGEEIERLRRLFEEAINELESLSSEKANLEASWKARFETLQSELSGLQLEMSNSKQQYRQSKAKFQNAISVLNQLTRIDMMSMPFLECESLMHAIDIADKLREEQLSSASYLWLMAIPVSFDARTELQVEYVALGFLHQAHLENVEINYFELYHFTDCLRTADEDKGRFALAVLETAIECIKDKLDDLPPHNQPRMWYIRGVELLARHYTGEDSLNRVQRLFKAAETWLTTNLDAGDNCLLAALCEQFSQIYKPSFLRRDSLPDLLLKRADQVSGDIVRHYPQCSFIMQGEYLLVVENSEVSSNADRPIRVIHRDTIHLEWDEKILHIYVIAPDPAAPGEKLKVLVDVLRGASKWYLRNFPKACDELFHREP